MRYTITRETFQLHEVLKIGKTRYIKVGYYHGTPYICVLKESTAFIRSIHMNSFVANIGELARIYDGDFERFSEMPLSDIVWLDALVDWDYDTVKDNLERVYETEVEYETV